MKYDVAIVGGGPAGYTAAGTAGKAGLRVVLFEKRNLGGVCLNEGCIPTKTLLYSARTYDSARHALKYGVTVPEVTFDMAKIIARKNKVVRKLVLGVKAGLAGSNVTVIQGDAWIEDRHTIRCGGETYACERLILCTGSETVIPPVKGVDATPWWTHREALDDKTLPESLVIVGGGVIGMEFASFFNSLGVGVTVIEMLGEILPGMDRELSGLLRNEYAARGVKFLLGTKVTSLAREGEQVVVSCGNSDGQETLTAGRLLLSAGRRAVIHGFGLENLGLKMAGDKAVAVNDAMETSLPGVYACGDVTGFSMLAHTAVREAEVAVHHILGKPDTMSYRAIPGVVYTHPEFAGVGQTEETLQSSGVAYDAVKLPMAFSGRFVAENEGVNGVCKVLLSKEGRNVLGAHVLGDPASEIITLAGMAIERKLTAEEWKRIVFPHPTVGEIFREAL